MMTTANAERKNQLEEGVALCLSGGGYRAMLFHVGSLWRLHETGVLGTLKRVSSVSGGSITAATLAVAWRDLCLGSGGTLDDLITHVVSPIRRLAGKTIDVGSILGGVALPWVTSGERIAAAYRKHLFGSKTLRDLPDDPRFVINATSVQSGALWRFSKPYMRDYRVGEVRNPTVELATAVAASSAFPPFLSPVRMKLSESSFTPGSGDDLQHRPFTTSVVLTDGGVYDNLGLETAYKRYRTLLVSDGGGKLAAEPRPYHDWARHAYRVTDVVDNQVRSLRKRQLIDAYVRGERKGAFWGIRTNIADYKLPSAIDAPFEKTLALAGTPTRLKRLSAATQERLINWGYAACDAALRTHVDTSLPPPTALPYPRSGFG